MSHFDFLLPIISRFGRVPGQIMIVRESLLEDALYVGNLPRWNVHPRGVEGIFKSDAQILLIRLYPLPENSIFAPEK